MARLLLLSCAIYACQQQQEEIPKKPVKPTLTYTYTYRKRSDDGTGKFYANREIAQIMTAEGAAWLNLKDQQKEASAKMAIDHMNLMPNSVVADIGAGTGYYTFRIAKRIPYGKVFAVEIQDDLIRYLNTRKQETGDSNVVVIKGDAKSPHLPDSSLDLAIMIDVYHELEYPKEMMQFVSKALKKTGKLLLIEYRAEDPKLHINPLHKMSVAQINKEMGMNGFRLSYDGEFLPFQHFLMYEKAP
ncbi:MAG: class I SAM-dependent methyltransferase [Bacteroidota bacterium]|nr:class I SAM-dependent methyltransferase [Bacteroidota bacterium]